MGWLPMLCRGVTLPTLGGSWVELVWGEWLCTAAGDMVRNGLATPGIGDGVRVSWNTVPKGTPVQELHCTKVTVYKSDTVQ